MEKMRKPFEGVTNIIRFNWHFYVIALVGLVLLTFCWHYFQLNYYSVVLIGSIFIVCSVLLSLLISWIVYDLSNLYSFNWLKDFHIPEDEEIVNINAGFDETSRLIARILKPKKLLVYDFFDPKKHTEVSIKRARKRYPPYEGTVSIATDHIPLDSNSVKYIFLMFSAHEIRDQNERVQFFLELERILKPEGKIIVVEHLRDLPNFIAYTIGFFHFHSLRTWIKTFQSADLTILKKNKINPFIQLFILSKHGIST